ncbi:MAG: hypothetical protein MI919_42945 [Holophagales bacterium]|nr:hypothetical protein [Holophagales bacterium]
MPWRYGAVLLALTLLGWGHYVFWYAARGRPGVPDGDVPASMLGGGHALVAWMPYPHQNLGVLARGAGLDTRALRSALRLAGMPEPAVGDLSIPPARSVAIASDASGETFVIRARVYPLFAGFARLAGWLADNPWLAGGRATAEGRPLEIAWQGTLWSIGSPRLPASPLPDASGTASGKAPTVEAPEPALLRLVARTTTDPIPPGVYRLDLDGGVLALSSEGHFPLEAPLATPEAMDEVGALLLAYAAGRPPPEDPPQALVLFSHDPDDLEELPRAAVIHGPRKRVWELPAEGLLDLAGRDPLTGNKAGFGLAATDAQTLAGAERLAPELRRLRAAGSLEMGLWLELERAAVEAGRLRRSLERSPWVSPRQLRRWREAELLLSGLAGPFDRLGLEIVARPGDGTKAGSATAPGAGADGSPRSVRVLRLRAE